MRRGLVHDTRGSVRFWATVVAFAPALYLLVVTLPAPFGLGLYWSNDFPDHRIWWTQVETYFWSHGFFPQWNPTFDLGSPYLASAFGAGSLYPLRWWTYIPTYFGGMWGYVAQYVQVAFHEGIALLGVFAVLNRFAGVHPATAALASLFVMLNQSFNNIVRFPNGVENFAWMTWVLYFSLALPVQRGGRAGIILPCALALCLSWLTGYGQFTLIFLIAIACIVVAYYRSLTDVASLALAILAGTISAIGAIYPALDWVRSDVLRNGKSIASINTDGVSNLWAVATDPFGLDVHLEYFSFPFFYVLVALGIVIVVVKQRSLISLGMLVALLIVADISRGTDGYLFVPLYEHLPFFSAFNSPAKDIWVAYVPMAWLAATGIESLSQSRRSRLTLLGVLCITTIVLFAAYDPQVSATDHGVWKPLNLGWITSDESAWAYRVLLVAGFVAFSTWLLVPVRFVRAAAAWGLVVVFVGLFAQFTTWFSSASSPKAMTATAEAFPEGLLGPRHAEYLGITGIGIVAPNVDPRIWDLLVTRGQLIRGDPAWKFPDTRFWWRPLDSKDAVQLRVLSAGPNHLNVLVAADGPGVLEYVAEFSPLMTGNVPLSRDSRFNDFYQLPVERGQQVFSLEFAPPMYLAAEVSSLLLLAGLSAACVAVRTRRRSVSAVCLLVGLAAAAWLLFGSTTRHSLGERELYGLAGSLATRMLQVTNPGP